ncbi:MAG TPA: hypothetical protein H9866_04690 [Candidatus Tidjanibacter gallistercoris]|nr:hypothetical protein [Candidatus Tidjanibacter gallistercoris]
MRTKRNLFLLWAVLCTAALVVSCDKQPASQEEEDERPEYVDYICTSCYRYVNGTSEPVSVEFHSAQYDLTPPPVEEAFTVAAGGRHEIRFAGFGLFPEPFCLGYDTWVKVSQGERQFVQRAGEETAFLLDSTAYERLEGDRLTRVYEYRFTDDDFAGAEIID